ncbi:NAD(P)H-dependent oxidoreductase [Croceitalea sp. MTPC9]|uniref:NAD(P)H-dependent oxidoreductase n=1 Tax=unclassified Croceitalea TaxID=2632280 RepID=UPI002B3CDC3E|nr:NAD(P)H-dependent oxidoreductase [Croceitalea sp. MTPC6]GMN18307.1 NAD(P)H-dependent oxidoreductase [Croceitalea sp. MTPC9]
MNEVLEKNILENRTWRYATKKFDRNKKVSDEDFNLLMESVRLSASSYGLQPYKVLVISNMEIREKLKPVSWGQSQITDASHLIVLANQIDFGSELVDNYISNVSETRNIPLSGLKQYGDFMKSKLIDLPAEHKAIWTAKQAYIALGNLMQAAAELKIDTCPMEGFEAEAYDKILGLTAKGLTAAVVLPIGYRSEEDETQHYEKVRKSDKDFFTHI